MSEEWECPICKKTVMVGYTVHIHCLDELISEFVEDLEKLESHRLFGKDAELYPFMVEIIKKWEEKLK